mmetsp:Transcript_10937/g.33540  ORF Transcript_10937/g.33540 Transcript_10937/m.33540 type:complete len:201 (+) Transcript_10937:1062-1664(+)
MFEANDLLSPGPLRPPVMPEFGPPFILLSSSPLLASSRISEIFFASGPSLRPSQLLFLRSMRSFSINLIRLGRVVSCDRALNCSKNPFILFNLSRSFFHDSSSAPPTVVISWQRHSITSSSFFSLLRVSSLRMHSLMIIFSPISCFLYNSPINLIFPSILRFALNSKLILSSSLRSSIFWSVPFGASPLLSPIAVALNSS